MIASKGTSMNAQTRVPFREILDDLILADAIYYRFGSDERLLWARSPAELASRGESLKAVHFTMECRSALEVDSLKVVVRRLKCLDRLP